MWNTILIPRYVSKQQPRLRFLTADVGRGVTAADQSGRLRCRIHQREVLRHSSIDWSNERTMPRQSKGPYLEFKRYRDRESRWVIRDGQKTKGTGLGTGASDEQKRQALADYLKKIHDPSPKRGGDPNQALVADCLANYLTKRLKRFEDNPPPEEDRRAWSRKKEDELIHTRLVKFFGTCTVGELTGAEQTKYTEQRGSVSSARRELNVLTAAINYYYQQSGGMHMIFRPTLPDAVAPRERWLTRQEAAKLCGQHGARGRPIAEVGRAAMSASIWRGICLSRSTPAHAKARSATRL